MPKPEIDLSIVVAMTLKRVIGNEGKLPWHLPGDLSWFKNVTMESRVIVMGYKTYKAIIDRNGEPLPGRIHIVLTRKHRTSSFEWVLFVHSPEETLKEVAALGGCACVIGGGEIYEIFLRMPELKTLYVTTVNAVVKGDTYFPDIKEMGWSCITASPVSRKHPKDEFESMWETYKRR